MWYTRMKKYIVNYVINPIRRVIEIARGILETIRKKRPDLFERAVKFLSFLIPIIGAFFPALLTNNSFRVIAEFLFLSLILVFQWAFHSNRLEAANNQLLIEQQKIDAYEREIKRLQSDDRAFVNYFEETEGLYNKQEAELKTLFGKLASFVHYVTDRAKKIAAAIRTPMNAKTKEDLHTFAQKSLCELESILSNLCKEPIRANIKIRTGEQTLSTYARGCKCIISRCGTYRCQEIDEKEINIADNYAYVAIVRRNQQFFAEGNLASMHNSFEADDVYFCEENNDDWDLYSAEVVMPIRIPQYHEEASIGQTPFQQVFGLLCIDSKQEIPEWSEDDFRSSLAYHIIASYADGIAMLFKGYYDAERLD